MKYWETGDIYEQGQYWFSGRDEMYKHKVQINAAKYTPMNDQLIVTGELR